MKIFIDSADIAEIREANSFKAVDGVTTNPSLVAKVGGDFKEILKGIIAEVDGPISAEIIASDPEGILKEGKDLAKLSDKIVIKVPATKEGLIGVKKLAGEGIRTNVTLIFSPIQALFAAKAGASYVSPFVGRLDDISTDGMELVSDIIRIYANYDYATEIIVASVRHPIHLKEAALLGADIATIPLNVIKMLLKHPLTDIGIARFLDDWAKHTGMVK